MDHMQANAACRQAIALIVRQFWLLLTLLLPFLTPIVSKHCSDNVSSILLFARPLVETMILTLRTKLSIPLVMQRFN